MNELEARAAARIKNKPSLLGRLAKATPRDQEDDVVIQSVSPTSSPPASPSMAQKLFGKAKLNESSIENDYEELTAKNNVDSLFNDRKNSQPNKSLTFAKPLTAHNTIAGSFPKHVSTKQALIGIG